MYAFSISPELCLEHLFWGPCLHTGFDLRYLGESSRMTHFSTSELYENRPNTIEMEPDTIDEMMALWKKNRSTGAPTAALARLSDEMEAFQQRRMENLSWRMMNMSASPSSPRSSITPMTSPLRPARITDKGGRASLGASGKVSLRDASPEIIAEAVTEAETEAEAEAEAEAETEAEAEGTPGVVNVRELIAQGPILCPPSPSGTLFSRTTDFKSERRSPSPISPQQAVDRGRSTSSPPLQVARPRSISSGDIFGTLKDSSALALPTIDIPEAESVEATDEDKEGDEPLFLNTPDDYIGTGGFSPPPPRRVQHRPARADSLRINPSAAMVFPR